MKNILIVFIWLFSLNSYSQSTIDKSLSEVSNDIADKLNQKNQKKIVVLYITDINNTQSVAGKYIADVISYNIVNNPLNFLVFDRENLSEITEAKKLIDEGYIDAAKAKELGKILAVEAIVIGNYTVLPSTLKLSLKALDVNSGLVVAASMKNLPLNEDAGALLGINVESGKIENLANRGFNNIPIQSNENYNNPRTVNKDCEIKHLGDYCFKNETNDEIQISIRDQSSNMSYQHPFSWETITVPANETQCMYNLKVGSYDLQVIINRRIIRKGQIKVEQCKSKTFKYTR